MKQQFLVECEIATTSVLASKVGYRGLPDQIADRVWRIDGIVHGSATCRRVGSDVVVISRVEYEELKARADHERRQY